MERILVATDFSPHAARALEHAAALARVSGAGLELLSSVYVPPLVAYPGTLSLPADYMRAPQRYDAEESWQRAVRALGAGAPEAFETFASAHRFGPMTPDERDPRLESAFERVRAGFTAVDEADEATGPLAAVEALKALIEVRLEVAERRRTADLLEGRVCGGKGRMIAELGPSRA